MPIPDYETLMLPLLNLAGENPNNELPVLNAVKSLATSSSSQRKNAASYCQVEERSSCHPALVGLRLTSRRPVCLRRLGEVTYESRNGDSVC